MKLILGLGVTGLSVARFFIRNNIPFRIADSRQEPPMLKISKNENLLHDFSFGDWSESLLDDISEVIISPGIAESESIVRWIHEKNISIISDIELFGRYVKAPIIGITGSNGKSTVTQLLGEMALASAFKAYICGNIGNPVMESIYDDAELYIVELSSYQLDYTNQLDLFAAVITNISPDHLDRYDNYEAYISSKLSIYNYCKHKAINLSDSLLSEINGDCLYGFDINDSKCKFIAKTDKNIHKIYFNNEEIISSEGLAIVGVHNIENILAALSLGDMIGLSIANMVNATKAFKGLEHRLEFVTNINSVDYFNDSKSTNANSTITAINALSDRYESIILIAGGIAKNEDYSTMFRLIGKKIQSIFLIGESKELFSQNIKGCSVNLVESMEEAVISSKKLAKEGAVLLSPGCASFDMFSDFSERGVVFKNLVLK
tara:strand:+ start:20 stop:1318 length:1299 start_codon:yes stop_codon:yes gene_type:complete